MLESSQLMWVGIAVAGGLALYFLGPPLLVLMTQRMEGSPEIIEYDPEETPPPRETARFFDDCDVGLSACGFRLVSAVVLPDAAPNVLTVIELYAHDRNQDNAMVVAMFGETADGPPLQARYVEFVTELRGSELEMIVTNNNLEVGAFPDRDESPTFRLPQVQDLRRLYDAHQQLVERHARGAQKQLSVFDRFGGDVAEFLAVRVLGESYEYQTTTGYLRYDRERDCYVPTFLGAYKMTWRILPPMKQFTQSRYRREGQRLERELLRDDDY